jgi:hypothetical protein
VTDAREILFNLTQPLALFVGMFAVGDVVICFECCNGRTNDLF